MSLHSEILNGIRRQIIVKGNNWLPCVAICTNCGEWRGGYSSGTVDECYNCGSAEYKPEKNGGN